MAGTIKIKKIYLTILMPMLIGESLSVYKAIDSQWEPPTRRSIIYTVATLTLTGSVVGWFDIPDYEQNTPVYYEPEKGTN